MKKRTRVAAWSLVLVAVVASVLVFPNRLKSAWLGSIMLGWTGSAGSPIGYGIYVGDDGPFTRNYNLATYDAGDVLQFEVPNLVDGVMYYFAADAYDINGNRSAKSWELSWAKPPDTMTVYENPADGLTNRWAIFDTTPTGATIQNVLTGSGRRAIRLAGTGLENGFKLYRRAGLLVPWKNMFDRKFHMEYQLTAGGTFNVQVEIFTDQGKMYLQYTPDEGMLIRADGTSTVVTGGVGIYTADGALREINRDLAADANLASPGLIVTEVNGVFVRAAGMDVYKVGLWE